ncbi:MAG: alpha/beta hydrolase [bacterium]|nr:alpha/beta hydrolase [bacterium]
MDHRDFAGFERRSIATSEVRIETWVAGSGPPLLLLHGFPQTHVMWHRVAPKLAERFTVVCPDMRGYGASEKPEGDARHERYAKRTMARDQVQVMSALGFERFAVAGHDRGARVAHRMALDHPAHVERIVLLDILPTLTVFDGVNQRVASGYYHWFFLSQPRDLPERMIALDPDFYYRWCLRSWSGGGLEVFDPEALEEYLGAMRDPATIHATCEDYRAGATIDLEHDRADIRQLVEAPMLLLWGDHITDDRTFDPGEVWERRVRRVVERALGCGHFVAEERPDELLRELNAFLG